MRGERERCRPVRRPQEGGRGRERWERARPQVRVKREEAEG